MSQLLYDFLAALAILVISWIVGAYLARRFRMPDYGWKFSLILFSVLTAGAILATRWPPGLGIDLRGGVILVYEVDPTKHDPSQRVDMDQLVAAIMRRVNPGGQREVTVRQYGENQVEVIIPQAEQAELDRIKRIISQTGSLEFRILCNDRDHSSIIELAQKNPQAREVLDSEGNRLAWWTPVEKGQETDFAGRGWETAESGKGDGEIHWRTVVNERGGKTLEVLVYQDPYDVKGDYLIDARPGMDRRGQICVEFAFDAVGAQKFSYLTGENVPDPVSGFRRRLGIILNGALYSAPNIESTIYDRGEITGRFTRQDVDDLVRVLKAGQLPAALTQQPISELVTGPTLGEDLIQRGTIATLLSILFIFVFMAIYYRTAGLVAYLAMLLNLGMVLALMITIHAELTLSGFAGLVLGVGMAVDANVLIYERMREELEREATLRMAIRNGFHRAMSAIVDSNLTTLITAVMLYVVGTDQIKGFAITLLLGVLLSLYTGVFCSRVVFDLMERQGWISRLRMLKMLGRTDINFLGARYAAVGFSGALILISLIGVWARGQGLFNIDFTGGVSVEVVFKEPQDIAEIRRVLGGPDGTLPDLAVSDVKLLNEPKGVRFIINTSLQPPTDPQTGQPLLNPKTGRAYTAVEWVEETLVKQFGDKLSANSFSIKSLETIQAASTPASSQAKPETKPSQPTKPDGAPKAEPTEKSVAPEAPVKPERKPAEPTAPPSAETPPSGPKSPTPPAQKTEPTEKAEKPQSSPSAQKTEKAEKEKPGSSTPSAKEPKVEEKSTEKTSQPSQPVFPMMFTSLGTEEAESTPAGHGAEMFPAWAGNQSLSLVSMADPPSAAPEAPKSAEAGKGPSASGSPAAEKPAAPAKQPSGEQPKPPEPMKPQPGPASEKPAAPAPSQPTPEAPEPAAPTPPKPALQPSGTPAKPQGPAKPEVFIGGTKAVLVFMHRIDYERFKSLIQEVLQQSRTGAVAFDLANPEYAPGISTAFTEWEVKLALPAEEANAVLEKVKARLQESPYFPSSNEIGGKVAGGTRRQAMAALLASLFFIIVYIWVRFQRLVYGLAAVVALVHDVIITLGVVALTYWLAPILGFLLIDEMKIGLDVLAAFLTLIGYSLNDTIVIFDRIREIKGKAPWITEEMINRSVNDTLARTIITGGGVIMGLLILYVIGGEGIHAFAFTMLFGVVTGTFSSVYIASPILLWLAGLSGEAKAEPNSSNRS